jgi:hypothetical protein
VSKIIYRNLLLAGNILVDEGLFIVGQDIELALFVSDEGVDFGAFSVKVTNYLNGRLYNQLEQKIK